MKGKNIRGGTHPLARERFKDNDSFPWGTIVFFVVIFAFQATLNIHENHVKEKYPNIDQKFAQMEAILKNDLDILKMPDSELIKQNKPLRKSDEPKTIVSFIYSSNKSWDNIRAWYMGNAPRHGWVYNRETHGAGDEIEFVKSKNDDRYKMSINKWVKKEDEENTFEVHMTWEEKRGNIWIILQKRL